MKLGKQKDVPFSTTQFSTGSVYDADDMPAGYVHQNGVEASLSVYMTKTGTGEYNAAFTPTTPGFAEGDELALKVTAVVDSISGTGFVWHDTVTVDALDDIARTLTSDHGAGIWISGGAAAVDNDAVASAVNTLLNSEHGLGIWASGTSSAVDNDAIASAVNTLLNSEHGLGLWVSGTASAAPTVSEISAQLTADHGLGIWISGTSSAVDNVAIASAVDNKLSSEHGLGIWASGTSSAVDNDAIASAVNTLLNSEHGLGIWTSGSTTVVDNDAIATAVNTLLTANHGLGIWVSGGLNSIFGQTATAENFRDTYNGVGYENEVAPAQQSQVGSLVSVGAPSNTPATSGSVLYSGTTIAGDYSSTIGFDGNYWQIADVAGSTNVRLEFDVGTTGVPGSMAFTGRINGVNDHLQIDGYDYATSAWIQIGTLTGKTQAVDDTFTYPMYTTMVGTGDDDGVVQVQFHSDALTSSNLYIQQIYCSHSVVTSAVGYANGAIWYDSVNGYSGAVKDINGVADKACKYWSDVITLVGLTNLKRIEIASGSIVTLSSNSDTYKLIGSEWTLHLNNQSIANAYIEGAIVHGTSQGTGARFFFCKLVHPSLTACGMNTCAYTSGLTLLSAGPYISDGCFSAVADGSLAFIDFGAGIGDTICNVRHYSGDIELKNMGQNGTDTMSLEGDGQYTINANCTGGELYVRGHFEDTDNAGGAVTVFEDARFTNPLVSSTIDTDLTAAHGAGIWVSGSSAVDNDAIASAVSILLNSEHGLGIWASGTSSAVDNDAIASAVNTVLTASHGLGIWVSGTSTTAPTVTQISAQLTADHGLGIWTSGTTTVDNSAVASAVNTLLTAEHGLGLWVSGSSASVDNDAVASAVNTLLTANHGVGLWVSGTASSAPTATQISAQLTADHGAGIWVSGSSAVDNAAIASAVNILLTANHGLGLWVSGSSTATVDNDAIAVAVNSLLDSNHGLGLWVSGSASISVDNYAVADAVNNVLNSNHGNAVWSGTSVTAIDTQLTASHGTGAWTASGGGSGSNTVTITVNDVGGTPIPSVLVSIYNSTGAALIAYGTTNTVGQVAFLLDAATYKVYCAKYATYTFTNPQTLVVSGTTTATYIGTLITGGLAPTPQTCVLSGRCVNGLGNVLSNVAITANVIGDLVTYQDGTGTKISVASGMNRTSTDSNGVWFLTLIRSVYLYRGGSSGVTYDIRLKGKGLDETKTVTVPNTATANYEDL